MDRSSITPNAEAAPRSRRAVISSLAGVAQRLLQLFATLLVMPLTLHALGAEGFGVWAAAASFLWMTVVVDFGVGQALLASVAKNMARGDVEQVRREIGAAILASLLLLAAVLALAAAVIPVFAQRNVATPYLIAAACLAINIPLSLAGNIRCGLQRFHATAFWEAFQTVLTLVGLYALSRFSDDVRLYVGVTAGGMIAANVGSAVDLFARNPELAPLLDSGALGRAAALMRRGAPLALFNLAMTLSVNLDGVVSLSLLGPDAAARMAVAQRACVTAYGLLWVVTQPLWPAFTDAATHGDLDWVRRHVFAGAAAVAACLFCGCSILLLFGERLVELWMGGGLTLGQEAIGAMCGLIVALSMGRIADVLLSGMGAFWFLARIAVLYSLLAFALKFWLGPSFGVAGVLWATPLAYALTYAPACLWWMSRWLRAAPPARAFSAEVDAGSA